MKSTKFSGPKFGPQNGHENVSFFSLVGGFNPLEKNMLVNCLSFPQVGVKIKTKIELPPPRYT